MIKIENPLNPKLELEFYDLYSHKGLQKLDKKFNDFLQQKNFAIYQKYRSLKNNTQALDKKNRDAVLIDLARFVEQFLVYAFDIENENLALIEKHKSLEKIYFVKREFVQRIIAKKYDEKDIKNSQVNAQKILEQLSIKYSDIDDLEKKLSEKIFVLLQNHKNLTETQEDEYDLLSIYAALALYDDEEKKIHASGSLFKLPQKIDHQKLFDFVADGDNVGAKDHSQSTCQKNQPSRNGFDLTDKGFSLNQTMAEAHYCIFCHNQDKDSCRTGLYEKNSENIFKKDPLSLELHGCPLDQKISEMNLLKSEGFSIASLAIATIDNPLLAGTGHRICNDCMKSCIYQKQDPVNIPQIESENLKDVLNLPYGFEIYSLLTRWNPLNFEHPIAQKNSGKKVLIAGLGPAGYTLAHYLLNDGHLVVAIDGLKIEPLDPLISGIDQFGNRQKFKPIKFLDEIYEPLSTRLIQGFGGVAEYGITVRWDKNFLKIIRLLLERRENFRMFGGLRFGSSITDKIAFNEYEFDHVALCIGAGRPNIINLKNNFAKGVRSASDFLMSLQLNGAFQESILSNLQIRMPIAVIGGGLTAVDSACEAQEYYFIQIKKFAKKIDEIGYENVFLTLNEEEKKVAKEFYEDAQILALDGKKKLLEKYGNVKILYRKKIQDSPAYRLNHQELANAFTEGVEMVQNFDPDEIICDEFGSVNAVKSKDEKIIDCKTLLIAAGTTPNIAPLLEDNLDFELDGKYFEAIDEFGNKIISNHSARPRKFSVLTKIDEDKNAVSFLGDLHPNFEGNVVKAMASAKLGHRQISEIINQCSRSKKKLRKKIKKTDAAHHALEKELNRNSSLKQGNDHLYFADSVKSRIGRIGNYINYQLIKSQNSKFLHKINDDFNVRIKDINIFSNHLVELTVKVPLLAKQTKIGQIFRLQNYHALAPKINQTILAMEGVPVTALDIDKRQGTISAIILDAGGSTALIKNFKIGDKAVFMGPSGRPTEIACNETVLLIGGGRGNMPLAIIARIYKKHGCKIIFCAGYRDNAYIARQNVIEDVSDVVIFAVENNKDLKSKRSQDFVYQGTVVDAIEKYFTKNPEKIDRIFTIGSDKMMAAIADLRHKNTVKSISGAKIAIASLNAPMQCMLKGVCSQCLQKRKNEQGEIEYFYSCASQDQDMDKIDFAHLKNRCDQNSTQEKITKIWLDKFLR